MLNATIQITRKQLYLVDITTFSRGHAGIAAGLASEFHREIIALVGEGLENKEIAERLRPIVAESTVRNNLSIIYDKLEIKGGRLALLVYAYKHGLIPLSSKPR